MFAGPWAFDVEPGVVALLLVIGGGYAWALHSLPRDWAPRPERPVTRAQVIFFGLGVAALAVAFGWPLHGVGEEYLFSAHMIQHMVVAYVAAPLLILGTPGWMLRAALGDGRVFRAVRRATRPLVAFVAFNVLIVVMHWPAFVDLSLRNEPVHAALHGTLLVVSLMVWMPVVSPLPELPRLGAPVNLLYLFGQSIVPTVPASFLTFGDGVVYKFYESVPRLWDISAIADQQVAGLIMKVGGGFLLWGIIAVLFFVWQGEEERRNRHPAEFDADELELELQAMAEAP